MSPDTMTTRANRTITAFFDDRAEADRAIERLVSLGIPRERARLVAGNEGGATSRTGATSRSYEDQGTGFWAALKDLFLPDEDRNTYAEGLRRGGYLLSVSVGDDLYEEALDILDDDGTIDIDERASSWRSEGWTGATGTDYAAIDSDPAGPAARLGTGAAAHEGTTGPAAVLGTGAATTSDRTSDYATRDTSDYARSDTRGGTRGGTGVGMRGEDEVIPIAEEQMRIGKRDVSHGRVRVRSYVVETPVEDEVSLRQEHVSVERRPVDRPLTGNEHLFQDRTIDVEERSEVPVIDKQARVKEELVVNKDVDQRTERVSDTVRRTEVEVTDDRGNKVAGKTARSR